MYILRSIRDKLFLLSKAYIKTNILYVFQTLSFQVLIDWLIAFSYFIFKFIIQ